MSDPLAERIRKLSEQHAKDRHAEADARSFQDKVNTFISDRSRPEYDRLLTIIKNRINEINPKIGDLPKFQMAQNGSTVEQGNVAAYVHFDKPILNLPNNALLISFGSHPNAMYVFDESARPEPVRYRLQAAAHDSFEHIVWTGDLGELTSEQLADFILEYLTEYYLTHKRT